MSVLPLTFEELESQAAQAGLGSLLGESRHGVKIQVSGRMHSRSWPLSAPNSPLHPTPSGMQTSGIILALYSPNLSKFIPTV